MPIEEVGDPVGYDRCRDARGVIGRNVGEVTGKQHSGQQGLQVSPFVSTGSAFRATNLPIVIRHETGIDSCVTSTEILNGHASRFDRFVDHFEKNSLLRIH